MQFRSYTRLTTSHFDLFVQTPRVIVERYCSRYEVTVYAFHFFNVLFAVYPHRVHLRSETNEFDHCRTVIFILHQPGYFFVRERHAREVRVVRRIIVRVESSDIA